MASTPSRERLLALLVFARRNETREREGLGSAAAALVGFAAGVLLLAAHPELPLVFLLMPLAAALWFGVLGELVASARRLSEVHLVVRLWLTAALLTVLVVAPVLVVGLMGSRL